MHISISKIALPVGLAAGLALALASAGSRPVGAQQSPTPSPSASPTPTISPSPTASPTGTTAPSPTVVVNGRPCEVGKLINDFLIYQDPSAPPERLPVPIPSCVQPGTVTAPPKLYGLNLPADTYTLHLEPIRGSHIPFVNYRRRDADQSAVSIFFTPGFSIPQPVGARDPNDWSAAPFLPVPGVRYDFVTAHTAQWIEPSGIYMITLDDPSLTLEQVAGLLVPLQLQPPNTGTGSTPPSDGSHIRFVTASLALLAAAATTTIALRRRAW